MDYVEEFKGGHIIVEISTNEEANYLYTLCGDAAAYSGEDSERYPYVVAERRGMANGYAYLERAHQVLRERDNRCEPLVISFAEFCAGVEPEPDTRYDDISTIL